jgi:transposase
MEAGQGRAERCRRDIVDAIRCLAKEGIQWRAIPCDFPPFQTVYDMLGGAQSSGRPVWLENSTDHRHQL